MAFAPTHRLPRVLPSDWIIIAAQVGHQEHDAVSVWVCADQLGARAPCKQAQN